MQCVLTGQHAVFDFLAALKGEIGVQLNHRGFGRDGLRRVNLDLVVVLRCALRGEQREEERQPQAARSHPNRMRHFALKFQCRDSQVARAYPFPSPITNYHPPPPTTMIAESSEPTNACRPPRWATPHPLPASSARWDYGTSFSTAS